MENYLISLSLIAMTVVAVILFLGLRNMAKGGNANLSQKLMRYRIAAQFVAIVVMMSALYFVG